MARARRPEPRWRLEFCHAEGGAWLLEATAPTRALLHDEILGPIHRPSHGDLWRMVSPEGLRRGYWVTTRRGLMPLGPVPVALRENAGRDWGFAWEEDPPDAATMLRQARHLEDGGPEGTAEVDRSRRVLAAADCAEEVVGLLGMDPLRSDPAAFRAAAERCLRAARDWGRAPGAETAREAREASSEARELRLGMRPRTPSADAVYLALESAECAATAASPSTSGYEQSAATAAIQAFETAAFGAPDFAAVVRRWIPLSVLLLARTGEPTPLSLGY